MNPIRPEDLAYGETDGTLSINAVAVADRLNALLQRIRDLEHEVELLREDCRERD